MRVVGWAFAISAALHAGALAWVTRDQPRPPIFVTAQPLSQGSPDPAREPEPTEVLLLGNDTPVATSPRDTAPVSHSSQPRAAAHMSTTRPGSGSGAEVRGPKSDAPSSGTGLLSMRRSGEGNGVDLSRGVSGGFLDSFLASSKPLEPPVPSTGELQQNGREFRSKHLTFDAHIERDGTAHLDTLPDVEIKPGCLFIGCKMGFDDALMRRHGIDPYASAKRQWLEKTFDERVAMGIAFRKDELAHSPIYMQQNLDWMWRRTQDPRERKQALFELWDEVAETGGDDLVKGGEAARAYLVGFVRARLPAGSPGAFTADELAALNAHKKSQAVFAPYEP